MKTQNILTKPTGLKNFIKVFWFISVHKIKHAVVCQMYTMLYICQRISEVIFNILKCRVSVVVNPLHNKPFSPVGRLYFFQVINTRFSFYPQKFSF